MAQCRTSCTEGAWDCSVPHGVVHACVANYADGIRHLRAPFWQAYADGLQQVVEGWKPPTVERVSMESVVIGAGFGTSGTSSLAAALNLFNQTVRHGSQPILLGLGKRPPSGADEVRARIDHTLANSRHGRERTQPTTPLLQPPLQACRAPPRAHVRPSPAPRVRALLAHVAHAHRIA